MKTTKEACKGKTDGTGPDTKPLYVDLPADLYRRVKIYMAQTDTWTDENGNTRSIQLKDVVTAALEDYLKRNERQSKR